LRGGIVRDTGADPYLRVLMKAGGDKGGSVRGGRKVQKGAPGWVGGPKNDEPVTASG